MSNRPTSHAPEENVIERTASAATVNLLGTGIFILVLVVVIALYAFLWGEFALVVEEFSIALWLFILLASIVLHELLHALGYRRGGAAWSDIKFGIIWYALTPYAHCKVPLHVRDYRVAVALPGVLLGLLPVIAGLAMGHTLLTFYGAIMTAAAGGDMIILWMLRSLEGKRRVQDHPSKPGFYLLVD